MTLSKTPFRAVYLRALLIILPVCAVKSSFCQQPADSNNKLFIALSPLGLIDYGDGSSFRFGMEGRVVNNLSLSFESIFYTSLGNVFAYKTDPRGFGIKPCIKLYLNRKKQVNGGYLGIEYMYKHQTYRLDDSLSLNTGVVYRKYSMRRYVNCISVKYGELTKINKRMLIEWFAGIGIRFFNSASSLSQQEYDAILRDEVYDNRVGAGAQAREIGNSILPNVVAGFKLCYRIK